MPEAIVANESTRKTRARKSSEVNHGDQAQKNPRAKKAPAVQQSASDATTSVFAKTKALVKKALGKSDPQT